MDFIERKLKVNFKKMDEIEVENFVEITSKFAKILNENYDGNPT